MAKRGPKGPSKYTDDFINKEADALLVYSETTPIPFECDFAPKRGYSSQRLVEFAAKNEKFSDALKIFKDIQEKKLVFGALANKINPTFAIFTLKNVAGWRDRQEIDHSGRIEGTKINVLAISAESITNGSRVQDNAAPNGSIKVLGKQ